MSREVPLRDVASTQVGPFAECPQCQHWIRLEEFEADEGGFVARCGYCDSPVWLLVPEAGPEQSVPR